MPPEEPLGECLRERFTTPLHVAAVPIVRQKTNHAYGGSIQFEPDGYSGSQGCSWILQMTMLINKAEKMKFGFFFHFSVTQRSNLL